MSKMTPFTILIRGFPDNLGFYFYFYPPLPHGLWDENSVIQQIKKVWPNLPAEKRIIKYSQVSIGSQKK